MRARVVGGVGTIADSDPLKQAASYLSATGQAGSGLDALANTLSGGGVKNLTDVARIAGNVGDVAQAASRVSDNPRLRQLASVLNLAKRFGVDSRRAATDSRSADAYSTGGPGLAAVELAAVAAADTAIDPLELAHTLRGTLWRKIGIMAMRRRIDDWSWQRGGDDDFLNSDAFKAFTSWSDPTGPGSSGDPNADGGRRHELASECAVDPWAAEERDRPPAPGWRGGGQWGTGVASGPASQPDPVASPEPWD